MPRSPEHQSHERFRELEPVPQWSATLPLNVPFEHFRDHVLYAAYTTRHRYTGFITRHPETGNVTSFTRTIYPRKKYGNPPEPEDCEVHMDYLAELLRTRVTVDTHHRPGVSRIVLGLYEGQHATGGRDDEPEHTVEELQMQLGNDAVVYPGEVFTARFEDDGSMSHYSESVGIVLTPTENKQAVYELGEATVQERFTVEDFADGGSGGTARMVETTHCMERDM